MADDKPDWDGSGAPRSPYEQPFPADAVIAKAPVDDRGRVLRSNWAFDTPPKDAPAAPAEPSPPPEPADDGKPTFTAEDLAHLEPADIEVDEAPAAAPATPVVGGLDAEEVAEFRAKLKSGVFTPEEFAKHFNLTPDEMAQITAPTVSPRSQRKAVEKELAEIAALRRNDAKGYRRNAEMQARERELLGLREKLKAESAPAEVKPAGLAGIEAELAKIAEARRSDPAAYRKDVTMQQRERELLQARETAEEGARAEAQLQHTTEAIKEIITDGEAFAASFDQVFGSLSAEAQAMVRHELSQPAPDVGRVTGAADMEAFSNLHSEAAKFVERHGKEAARRHAVAEARMGAIVDSMPEADAERAKAWIRSLPPADIVGLMDALGA